MEVWRVDLIHRIAFVTERYFPAIGGAETYTKCLAEHFAASGVRTEVFNSRERRNHVNVVNKVIVHRFMDIKYPKVIQETAQKIYFQPVMQKKVPVNGNLTPLDYLEGCTLSPLCPQMLIQLSTKKDITIFHSTGTGGSPHWYAYLASKHLGKPWIMSPFFHFNIPFFHKPSILKSSKAAVAILVSSEIEKGYFASYGVDPCRIHNIGVGVDPFLYTLGNAKRFRASNSIGDNPIVLFIGRRSYAKGLYHLIRAMQSVIQKIPNVRFVIVDTGPVPHSAFPWEIPSNDNILYLGPVNQQDKLDIINATDVLALPSIDEAFGIVYLEAWCCSKPVIAADTPLMRELVGHNERGLLVPFGDVNSMAQSIVQLLEDSQLRKRLGERGFQRVMTRYTWEIIKGKIQKIYDDIPAMR